jgi:hypothetical protein
MHNAPIMRHATMEILAQLIVAILLLELVSIQVIIQQHAMMATFVRLMTTALLVFVGVALQNPVMMVTHAAEIGVGHLQVLVIIFFATLCPGVKITPLVH